MKFTVHSTPAVLRKSKPWEGYDGAARSLADAIRAITQAPAAKPRKAALRSSKKDANGRR